MIARDLARAVPERGRVAVADGAGMPVDVIGPLGEIAADKDCALFLGWSPGPVDGLEPEAFRRVDTFMPGHGLRRLVRANRVRSLPLRLSALPAALAGPLRPDAVVVRARPVAGGFALGTEVGWSPAAIEAARQVLVVVDHGLPSASRAPVLAKDRVVVVGEAGAPVLAVADRPPDPTSVAIGRRVAGLVPRGAAVQVGPGALGAAVLDALEVPVRIDSGVIGDAVVRLHARGLLLDDPLAGYLLGSAALYEWADGRPILDRVEVTHDPTRVGRHEHFVAVNTALEIDLRGQVNVERRGDDPIGGIGGSADYALAAARHPRGLSVVALSSRHGDRSSLVEQLSAPVSTMRSDVDVVVTELGCADLRALDDRERAAALRAVFG